MNGRLLLVSAVVGWSGATLLLQRLGWFGRPTLAARLRPYLVGSTGAEPLRPRSVVEEARAWAGEIGARVGRLAGTGDELARRLARVHADETVEAFRVRQVGWAVGGMAAAAGTAALLGLAAPVAVLALLSGPALGFLLPEQRLGARAAARQRQVFGELPVVTEQLALLLGAGWSLGSSLQRLAARGTGAVSVDLERVCRRIRHGVGEEEALREWADVAGVADVSRLVAVLVTSRATSDLGRLVSEEARQVRREAHRRLVVQVERRNQQVWIPVTVAALVPGVLFLAIPFVEALRAFGG